MFTARGKMKGVVSFKLAPGDDLEQGLIEVCKKHDLQNGVILTAFGSLQSAVIKNPIYNSAVKYNTCYGEPLTLPGPIELVGTSGVICHTEDGELLPHIHISLSDQKGLGHGGHLCPGTRVAITVEGAIAEFEGINMKKVMDMERNILIFVPEEL